MLSLLQLSLDIGTAARDGELTGATSTIGEVISSLLSGVMVIGALMLLMYLIWGGIEWISAGGDSGKIQKARDKITQSVIGLIVLASSVAIFSLVQQFVGVEALQVDGGSSSGGSNAAQSGGAANARRGFFSQNGNQMR
jgi:hypothetical protein